MFPWILYRVNDPLPGFRRWHVRKGLYSVQSPTMEINVSLQTNACETALSVVD